MSKVNTQELSVLIQELQTLSNKPKLTPSEERRNAFLLAAISAVKAGTSLAEIEAEGDNAQQILGYCRSRRCSTDSPQRVTHLPVTLIFLEAS